MNINTDWMHYPPAPHQSWKLKNPIVLVRTYKKIKIKSLTVTLNFLFKAIGLTYSNTTPRVG